MKKERIITRSNSFRDPNGDERHFVIAVITEHFEEGEVTAEDEYHYYDMVKGVKVGFAICNPADTFNEELGKTIAIGRARKNADYALLASKAGYINTRLIDAFLEQEVQYFISNPEYQIAGYKRMISRK